jgi:hypothetical protein
VQAKAAVVIGLLALVLAICVGVAACSLSDDPESDSALGNAQYVEWVS